MVVGTHFKLLAPISIRSKHINLFHNIVSVFLTAFQKKTLKKVWKNSLKQLVEVRTVQNTPKIAMEQYIDDEKICSNYFEFHFYFRKKGSKSVSVKNFFSYI